MANSAELYRLKLRPRVRGHANITFFKSESVSAAHLCCPTGSDPKVDLQSVAILL
jgi:hypothetical protein